MRFNIIFVLLVVLATVMSFQAENVQATVHENSILIKNCEAQSAYQAGLNGDKKPEACKIGQASVAFDSWLRGQNDRQEKLKLDTSRAPLSKTASEL